MWIDKLAIYKYDREYSEGKKQKPLEKSGPHVWVLLVPQACRKKLSIICKIGPSGNDL